MKQTKATCVALAFAMMASSCGSAYQAESGVRGAMIGGHVGEMVGLLSGHGHFRGENAALGSLIGMGIGAILGVSVASQIEEKEKAEAQRYDEDYNTANTPSPTTSTPSAAIKLSDLTYMDTDGDGYITKDEIIEVEGFITNTSNSVINDIVIYLVTNDDKSLIASPSLTTTLQPGQKIRYTGRIHCRKTRGLSEVEVQMHTSYANKNNISNSLFIPVK